MITSSQSVRIKLNNQPLTKTVFKQSSKRAEQTFIDLNIVFFNAVSDMIIGEYPVNIVNVRQAFAQPHYRGRPHWLHTLIIIIFNVRVDSENLSRLPLPPSQSAFPSSSSLVH